MHRRSLPLSSVVRGIPRLGRKPHGWSKVTFGDVLEAIQRPVTIDPDQSYQLINVKRNRGGVIPRRTKRGSEIKTKTQFLARAGDFVISRRQIVHGACGIVPPELDRALVSNEYATLVPKEGLCLEFLSCLSHTSHFQKTCFHASVGIVIEKMIFNLDAWLEHPFYLPPLKEQRRIFRVLAASDRAISQTASLIAARQRLKDGLAQRLLTGSSRLPGSRLEKWHGTRLGDTATVIVSGVDKRSSPEETRVRLCNYMDVYYNDRIGLHCDFMVATASAAEIERCALRKGDVIITKDSETPHDIAKPAIVVEDMPGVICGYHLAILRPRREGAHGPFLAQLLGIPQVRHEFYRASNGVTRFGLGRHAIENLILELPSPAEQLRIAALLDSIDRHIDLLGSKLSALRELKKGVMQKLFGE